MAVCALDHARKGRNARAFGPLARTASGQNAGFAISTKGPVYPDKRPICCIAANRRNRPRPEVPSKSSIAFVTMFPWLVYQELRHYFISNLNRRIALARPIFTRSASLIVASSNQIAAWSMFSNGQSVENMMRSEPISSMASISD